MMLDTNPRLKQINKHTLWDKAYLSLKSALLAGKYAPGERIILRKVAQDLGISLTPVRDAINRLAAENVAVATCCCKCCGGWCDCELLL